VSIEDLADQVVAEPPKLTDQELAEELEGRGYVVTQPRPQETVHEFPLERIKGRKRVRLGVVSDTHLCSAYQQVTYLRSFYRYAEEVAKVDAFLHGGDLTDGPHHMHRDAPYNLFRHGFDAQRDYVVEAYPKPKKKTLKTHFIGGNHDAATFNQVGADICEAVAERRPDMDYLGDQRSAFIDFGPIRILLAHPYVAGSTITLSRPAQRVIEQMAPEHKPHILLLGNWHRSLWLPSYRNIEAFQLPSFQATTPFLRGRGLLSVVGGWIIEFGIDASSGLAASIKAEMVRYVQPIPDDFPQ
jgi:hypothetical protein